MGFSMVFHIAPLIDKCAWFQEVSKVFYSIKVVTLRCQLYFIFSHLYAAFSYFLTKLV